MAESDAEVVVIGGGSAGVAAARRLHDASIRCLLVEARGRLGGRAWTVTDASGFALDLGCGSGRNTRYLIRHGWDAIGIDMLGPAIDKARSQVVETAAKARFLQGDVTRLNDLHIGDGFSVIVDSGCYYGLSGDQRDSYAAGVTRVAAPGALLLMAGFTKIPGIIPGISEEDLRRRFRSWDLRTSAAVPADHLARHTRIPFPLKALLRTGRLEIRRFELTKTARL